MHPPDYRVDAEPQFVFEDDPAIADGYERANREFQDLPPGERDKHPMWVYYSGQSRFDLGTIGDYLEDGKAPTVYVLKRLSLAEYARITDIANRVGDSTAKLEAVRVGLKRIDGPSDVSDVEAGPRKALRESDLERLGDAIGAEKVLRLGWCVLKTSERLRANEGKPSGS